MTACILPPRAPWLPQGDRELSLALRSAPCQAALLLPLVAYHVPAVGGSHYTAATVRPGGAR